MDTTYLRRNRWRKAAHRRRRRAPAQQWRPQQGGPPGGAATHGPGRPPHPPIVAQSGPMASAPARNTVLPHPIGAETRRTGAANTTNAQPPPLRAQGSGLRFFCFSRLLCEAGSVKDNATGGQRIGERPRGRPSVRDQEIACGRKRLQWHRRSGVDMLCALKVGDLGLSSVSFYPEVNVGGREWGILHTCSGPAFPYSSAVAGAVSGCSVTSLMGATSSCVPPTCPRRWPSWLKYVRWQCGQRSFWGAREWQKNANRPSSRSSLLSNAAPAAAAAASVRSLSLPELAPRAVDRRRRGQNRSGCT